MYCNEKMKSVLTQDEVAAAMQSVRDHIVKAQCVLATLPPEALEAVNLVHQDNDGTDYGLMRSLRGAEKQAEDILGYCMNLEGYKTTDQVQRERQHA
jgi:hypothetical protein